MHKYLVFLSLLLSNAIFALEPVVIVLGPPGSGKGNLSQMFKKDYDYNHLSAGDLVRQEIEKQTPIGLQIADVVKRGDYIDAGIMHSLMVQSVSEMQKQNKPFMIDGFGGKEHDIQFLYDLLANLHLLSKTFVVFLDAEDIVCKQRMSGRLICGECEHIYNCQTLPPETEGKCDFCLGNLVQRANDTPEVIEKRIALYRERVEPNYRKALTLFPSLFLRTDANLGCCAEVYKELAEKIAEFEGDAEEFIGQNFLMSYPHFIYDRYTLARGEPAMLEIFCRNCGQWVCDYQKDGPGDLLRCYKDRIRSPEALSKQSFTPTDLDATPGLVCKSCNTLLGQPMIYKKEREKIGTENRPAYLILADEIEGISVPRIVYSEKE